MRQSLLRRLVAALFVVVGIGAISSGVNAQAATTPQNHTVQTYDWQWGG